ncbi:hypothetical protein GXP67_02715 [Rhodocytophaga rosea]|uniref:Uncharacterized protein n=1 Tax=Rhodocytophaga rosea TaxID=2704465 RepID=A0A6C0GCW2_9BACT|nr:UPF0158 family protein [Rhodocytophaga rosea]QHT65653.1 hypothetical protein GXP67_02715 [Rhodocytophaga rosea]
MPERKPNHNSSAASMFGSLGTSNHKKERKMIQLSKEQIKEISERLECGEKCFVQIHTQELVFYMDPLKNLDLDEEYYGEEMQKVEENRQDYLEIEGMDSREGFQLMEEFAQQVNSKRLQERLYRALNQRKPFQHFKHEIDNSGAYREAWFAFKNQKMQDWVEAKVVELNRELEQ